MLTVSEMESGLLITKNVINSISENRSIKTKDNEIINTRVPYNHLSRHLCNLVNIKQKKFVISSVIERVQSILGNSCSLFSFLVVVFCLI